MVLPSHVTIYSSLIKEAESLFLDPDCLVPGRIQDHRAEVINDNGQNVLPQPISRYQDARCNRAMRMFLPNNSSAAIVVREFDSGKTTCPVSLALKMSAGMVSPKS